MNAGRGRRVSFDRRIMPVAAFGIINGNSRKANRISITAHTAIGTARERKRTILIFRLLITSAAKNSKTMLNAIRKFLRNMKSVPRVRLWLNKNQSR